MRNNTKNAQAYQTRHIAAGLCANCNNSLSPRSLRYCEKHLARNRKYLEDTNYWQRYMNRMRSDPKAWKIYRDKQRARQRLRKISRPDIIFAHTHVLVALRRGDLVRPSNCEHCHINCKPDAHHDDYGLPGSVRWLCKKCHAWANKGLERPL